MKSVKVNVYRDNLLIHKYAFISEFYIPQVLYFIPSEEIHCVSVYSVEEFGTLSYQYSHIGKISELKESKDVKYIAEKMHVYVNLLETDTNCYVKLKPSRKHFIMINKYFIERELKEMNKLKALPSVMNALNTNTSNSEVKILQLHPRIFELEIY